MRFSNPHNFCKLKEKIEKKSEVRWWKKTNTMATLRRSNRTVTSSQAKKNPIVTPLKHKVSSVIEFCLIVAFIVNTFPLSILTCTKYATVAIQYVGIRTWLLRYLTTSLWSILSVVYSLNDRSLSKQKFLFMSTWDFYRSFV
jgi:hypothetical protein